MYEAVVALICCPKVEPQKLSVVKVGFAILSRVNQGFNQLK